MTGLTTRRGGLWGVVLAAAWLGPWAGFAMVAAAEQNRVPEGLSAADWSSIRTTYEANRHAAIAVEEGYRARNPGQRWKTLFDGRGFLTKPDAGRWSWGLDLIAYGPEGAEQLATTPRCVEVNGQRIEYEWDEVLTEWYINDQRGLEHGYTLRQRPAGGAGPLRLTLAVRGDLHPQVSGDRRAATFVSAAGAVVVNYSGLKVFDATGACLPAWFEEARCRQTTGPSPQAFSIVVDDSDAVYPLTIDPIAQQAYIKASNTDVGDEFGRAVAMSGDTLVVGAPREDSNATGVNGNQSNNSSGSSGAAYVFVRSGSVWSQQAYLKASNTGVGDQFGNSVAASGDTVVVGAHLEDSNAAGVNGNQADNSAFDSGAAYVFVRSGTTWSQQAYLKASNSESDDNFGWRVSVSGDTVVVGARYEDSNATGVNGNGADNSLFRAGAAYVFVRSGTTWSQQAYLKASNTGANDWFGFSVAASGDTVVVGAPIEDSSATGVNGDQVDNSAGESGASYVFVRSGAVWTQEAYLKASNTGANDQFGGSLALSNDTLVVGAVFEDSNATGVNGNQADNSVTNSGAAYIFVRDAGGVWSQQAYVKASNTELNDSFGSSVSVFGDIAVVGAPGEDSNATGVNGDQSDNSVLDAGAAYVFVRCGGTVWRQRAYLKASNPGGSDTFGLGFASVSTDTVLVPAYREDSNATGVNGNQANESGPDSGAAYVFVVLPEGDSDGDGVDDTCDNCPTVANPTQADADGDSIGDACDTCADTDGDGFGNPGFPANTCPVDNCPTVSNPTQANADGDALGDACDTCMDTDGDGYGDPGFPANTCPVDNCPTVANPTQADADGDSIGDACDTCMDTDGDGFGDPGFPANTCAIDNCPTVANPGQENADGDSLGDACDTCTDTDGDGFGDPGFPANTCAVDNCPTVANPGQENADGDSLGDACDTCTDTDGDGFGDPDFPANTCAVDNCPTVANPEQENADGDSLGDACDTCTDTDGDGFGDPGFPANTCAVDNCPTVANPGQENADGDSLGDACDTCTDTDGDGFGNPGFPANTCPTDNCPGTANANQSDEDNDGIGDACEADCNGNGVADENEISAQIAKLLASDAIQGDRFGFSVAVSGDTAVIGAHLEGLASPPSVSQEGSAYVFVRSAGVWAQQQKLTASDAATGDEFGISVSIFADTVVIGAHRANFTSPSRTDVGAAYVFARSAGVWTQQAKLTASDAAASDRLGSSVAVSGDTVVVGAIGSANPGTLYSGFAYVFVKPGGGWANMTQTAKLSASDGAGADRFGSSVGVSGNTVVVGAYLDDHAAGVDAGSAYVFVKPVGGWVNMTQTGKLTAEHHHEGDKFGNSVAVSGDTVLIGAPSTDVHLERPAGNGVDADSGALLDESTTSGTSRHEEVPYGVNAGAAYAFVKSGGGWADMTESATLLAVDGYAGDNFGVSVAISGNTVAVGANGDNDACPRISMCDSGSAYVFARSGGIWMHVAKLTAAGAGQDGQFGISVAVSSGAVVVGEYLDDDACVGSISCNSGSAHAFAMADCNGNGMLDACETESDGDGDGRFDACDNCPSTLNTGQEDADGDGIGDACDSAACCFSNGSCQDLTPSACLAAGGAPQPGTNCSGMTCPIFPSSNVTLRSWLPLSAFSPTPANGNDCWGYTSFSGRRYALMGLSNQLGVVEITDPSHPVILPSVPHYVSTWAAIKVHGNYCYASNETNGGIEVVDLSNVDSGVVTLVQRFTSGGILTSHTLTMNEQSGYLYLNGSNINEGAIVAISLADPANPVVAGMWDEAGLAAYCHDSQVVTYTSGPYAGREIAFCCDAYTGFDIVDVTDKGNMFLLARRTYPNLDYCHQGWLSEDRRYFYINDELDGVNESVIFDVSDLNNPVLAGSYSTGPTATDHNQFIRGNLMFESDYTSGLRISCLGNATNPASVGFFDTYPESDTAGYLGTWSNYPFFPNGIVLISDINRGLFVVDASPTDLDGDGLGNACDTVDNDGDMDHDGIANGEDISAFQDCFLSGSASGGCAAADMDDDGDVDDADVDLFVQGLLGA